MNNWYRTYQNLLESDRFFYHGSYLKFKDGQILTPQTERYVMHTGNAELEAIMEKYRPSDCVSRFDAIFMTSDVDGGGADDIDYAGGNTDYIYIVKPLGKITKCNLHWYSEVQMLMDQNAPDDKIKDCVLSYWHASIPREWNAMATDNFLFEYLTPSAQIIKMIEDNT